MQSQKLVELRLSLKPLLELSIAEAGLFFYNFFNLAQLASATKWVERSWKKAMKA